MSVKLAAPTVQGYSRRFWAQLKIGYRDFMLALAAGVVAPLVAHFGFHANGTQVAAESAAIAAVVVFVGDCTWKAIRLLWVSYRRLQDALSQVQTLTTELRQQRERRIGREVSRAEFWWDHRTEKDKEVWITGVTKWELSAIATLADYLGIDSQSAKDKLWDFTVMDGNDVAAFLKRKIDNLKKYLPVD